MNAQIDLHCHSTISDGTLPPHELVAHAAKSGIKVLALTDHDDVSGLQAAREAASGHGIQFINGVEISATWKKRTLHIVGLKIDAENKALKTALAKVRIGRDERAQEMAAGLAKVGIHGAYEGANAQPFCAVFGAKWQRKRCQNCLQKVLGQRQTRLCRSPMDGFARSGRADYWCGG
jgi:predicted metal-dependent phosphoesterase TrpH